MTVASVFGVARSQLTIRLAAAQGTGCAPVVGQAAPAGTEADATLVTRVRGLVRDRATYGYRRVAAVFRREFLQGSGQRVNHKWA
jgi:hypothetical protein